MSWMRSDDSMKMRVQVMQNKKLEDYKNAFANLGMTGAKIVLVSTVRARAFVMSC